MCHEVAPIEIMLKCQYYKRQSRVILTIAIIRITIMNIAKSH